MKLSTVTVHQLMNAGEAGFLDDLISLFSVCCLAFLLFKLFEAEGCMVLISVCYCTGMLTIIEFEKFCSWFELILV